VKLKKLLKDISVQVKGSKEIEISGITAHSKLVAPGNLFVAKKGLTCDGARFIPDALAAGAVAILTDIYDPFLENVVQLIHPDVPSLECELAKQYYQAADEALLLVGITGTNGKTTCSYLVKHLLEKRGTLCGLIGTIEWIVGKNTLPSMQTTPDVITNHKLFYEMLTHQCKAAVMEVSSHALDQGRVRAIDFDIALFTNLTRDHLDYHKTMEEYAAAKSKLFAMLGAGKVAIVNADDAYSPLLLKDCKSRVLTYGIESAADVRATDLVLSAKGVQFVVHYGEEKLSFTSSLIGRFNVYNCLAAIAVGVSQKISLSQVLEALRSFKRVPGRLERVANSRGLNIFVDYAHTDDALKNVLETLKEIKKGRLITVFGCGGGRDPTKRPYMGAVAEQFSDQAIVTSDNPRNEDPSAIIQQILTGIKEVGQIIVEPDRKRAIEQAIRLAQPDDILLIAGKGHETYQILAHQTIDFDDRKIATEACEALP
jgi:UDP-N-acetylmuramoyl-L-alanyl-D-glutamate--2,6-diaminopimelate ligase